MTDPRHLLLVGTGPGLGAAVARRFAREGYRLTLVARSPETIATIAQELRAAGTDVAVVQADAGDAASLRAALSPLYAASDGPGGAVVTAQVAVPAMRAAGGGTLLFTGGGFADALPESLATLSLGKVALRAVATMLARQLRDDNIHAGSFTILGQIVAGTPFDADRVADAYWAVSNAQPDAWREEYRFEGAEVPAPAS